MKEKIRPIVLVSLLVFLLVIGVSIATTANASGDQSPAQASITNPIRAGSCRANGEYTHTIHLPLVTSSTGTTTTWEIRNPGFEGITQPGGWTRETFNGIPYTEIFTPEDWVTFWSEGENPYGGQYGRPECKVIPNEPPFVGPPARIRSGDWAVQQFGFFRAIDSGLYQVVTGLSPHAIVQASAYAHAWSCDDDEHGPYSCGDLWNMLFRVGIDPNGGTDPWSPDVIWADRYSNDEYRLIGPAQAEVEEAGTVTVFLRATAEWPFKHNDVYWDDASLVVLSR
jgi:hypothetical protein